MQPVSIDALRAPTASSVSGAVLVRVLLLAGLVGGPLLLQAYSFQRYGRCIRLTDEYFYYAHARSWYFDHDCDYANDMLMAPGFENAAVYAAHRTPTGRVFNHFPCGTAIVSLPFLALADGLTAVHNLVAARPLPRDGYSAIYQITVALGHTLLGIAGLLAGYTVARRRLPAATAGLAMLAVWLGTGAIYYVGYESPHSHAASVGFVGLLILSTDNLARYGLAWRRWLALGLCAGMMVATRPQDLVWMLVPAGALLPVVWRQVRQGGRAASLGAGLGLAVLAAALCYVPQALVNISLFGRPLVNTYGQVLVAGQPAILHWGAPDFLRMIVHTQVGVLWTAPLVLLATIGVAGLVRRRSEETAGLVRRGTGGAADFGPRCADDAVGFEPRGADGAEGLTRRRHDNGAAGAAPWSGLGWGLLLGYAALLYVVACIWWNFSGYGHRYLMSGVVVWGLGLAVVLNWAYRTRFRRIVVGGMVTACVLWQMGLFVAVDRGWRPVSAVTPLARLWSPPTS